jgi:hypothetical protein
MQIDKAQILSLLQNLGDHDKAAQADSELPDQVDTEQHAGLLDKLGINVGDLLGGGGAGGIAGKLGL